MGKKQMLIVGAVVLVIVGVVGTVFAMSGSDDHDHNGHSHDDAKTSSTSTTSSTSNSESTAPASSGSEQTSSNAVAVEISNFAYSPTTLTVKVGTTVTWTNKDSARHDVAADKPSSDAPSSELLGRGESYSFTFNKAGTYSYHCTPHPNMQAKVIVTE